MNNAKKKTYKAPKLQSRKIELGVFGAYGPANGETGPATSGKNNPLGVAGHLGLRME